jgi:dihydroflavonol-4-reductase
LGTVFVTGANGYLGSWIVYYLLQNKYNVKASVRNLSNKESYQHLLDFDSVKKQPSRLQIVEGKLEDRELWVDHLQGCYAVIHSASPNPYLPVKRDLEIIYPAVEGTLAILHAAQANGIQYFVLTGSLSNVRGTQYRKVYNEDVWADIDGISAYEQSKLLSERCAVFFNKENGSFTQLTTLLPGTMFGPT